MEGLGRLKRLLDRLRGTLRNSVILRKIISSGIVRKICDFLSEYWLLCYFIALIAYLELLYRIWTFYNVGPDYLFAFLFALPGGAALYIFIHLFTERAARVATAAATSALGLIYGTQMIYYCIFRTPLSLFSVGGAKDAMQFWSIALEAILKNAAGVAMLFIPLALLILFGRPFKLKREKPFELSLVMLFGAVSFSFAIACVSLTGDSPVSQYTLYFKENSPELSINKLGVMTTMRLDFERLVLGELSPDAGEDGADGRDFGNGENSPGNNDFAGGGMGMAAAKGNGGTEGMAGAEGNNAGNPPEGAGSGGSGGGNNPGGAGNPGNSAGGGNLGENTSGNTGGVDVPADGKSGGSGQGAGEGHDAGGQALPAGQYNVMDIDFEALAANTKNETLKAMHQYFSTVRPTSKNRYTGMFKGCNLIMFTAEGFSPYVISRELTPTLYMMANEGFVFRNFYNPVWGVSTSDGEYVACTGLIPKSGVWSFYKSANNYMPFVMGNQFKKLGYLTKAYHNHTYTYYRRDASHPNMGYEYKGVGNGLNVKKTWPESDLEMINVTADEYIGGKPFHTYYMTVSGHMNYTFGGNYMASKNRKLVEHLPYSDASKAYIACNLELEFAMEALMDKLEAAGVAENTVIVISADHYPYGLDKKYIDELAGHEVEKNFELYRSTLVIYKKGMEPVVVDKPCASLDIIPTLSNLFGLEYDSRLLMGADILSDTPPLVIFSNRSWITDRALYNSVENTVAFLDGTDGDKDYVRQINRVVADKFKYSAKILETDYYRKISGK